MITFGFSKSKTLEPFGLAIRAIEKRSYSHVYIKYQDEFTGDMMVFQASHGTVHLVLESSFLNNSIVIEEYEMPVGKDVYFSMRKKMNRYLGLKYGFLQILNIMVQKLFRSKDIKLMENGEQQFICSELGFSILKEAYPALIDDQDSVTPSDFNVLINMIGLKRNV